MSFDKGFDFRATAALVTDPAGSTYVLPTDSYPTTRNGVTFGWTTPAATLDRNSSNDARLTGVAYSSSAGMTFRIDLPASGTYTLHLAMGDGATGGAANTANWVIQDGASSPTTLKTYALGAIGADNHFYDANSNLSSAAAWPGSETGLALTFATTQLLLVSGATSPNSDVVAHLRVVGAGGASFSLSPPSGATGNSYSVTATGSGTAWTSGTTFSVSGGAGASVSGLTVNVAAQTAAFTLTAGTAAGTLTVSDSADSATAAFAVTAPPVTVPVTDPNWYFSPMIGYSNGSGAMAANNVLPSSTSVQSANSHFYFKMGFTGTSFRLNCDTTALTAASIPTAAWPWLMYSIDEEPVASAANFFQMSSATPINRTGLAGGSHTIWCMINKWVIPTTYDRWTTPSYVFKVLSATLDNGASTVAPSGWVGLKPRVCYFNGDSITEAYITRQALGSNTATTDGYSSWAVKVAAGMNAEFGVDARSGGGYVTTNGQGNVPPYYNAGTPSNSWWNQYSSGKSKLIAGKFPAAVDYHFLLLGANDTADSTTASTLSSVLPLLRAAHAPTTWVFVVVPMGGQRRVGITNGFNAYQAATPDARCAMLDAGTAFQAGLENSGASYSLKSQDTLHPYDSAQTEFAAIVVRQAQAAIGGGSPAVTLTGGFNRIGMQGGFHS